MNFAWFVQYLIILIFRLFLDFYIIHSFGHLWKFKISTESFSVESTLFVFMRLNIDVKSQKKIR